MTVVTRDLDFSSGSILTSQTPKGPWDAREASGVTDEGVIASPFPGFTNAARFRMHPGSETQQGWGNRELVRMDTIYPSPASSVGTELWMAGAFMLPSAGNSGGKYNASMIFELFHNANGVVNSNTAPIGIFVGTQAEHWSGSAFSSISSTPGLYLRSNGGWVPNQQPGGSHPGTDPSYWHGNIQIPGFAPEPYDIPIWFILHVICHEFGAGAPPGGYNIRPTSPAFTGIDTGGGTLELWIVKKSTQPTAADFVSGSPTLAWSPGRGTAIPSLVFGDDGNGNGIHDQPYGPFMGSYDSSNTSGIDTISYNSEVDWAGMWLKADFASAVNVLTGGGGGGTTLPNAPVGATSIGKTTPGSATQGDLGGYKRASPFTVTESGQITAIWELVSGGAADVKKRAQVHLVSGGQPTTLLGESSEITVLAGQAVGWVKYVLGTPATITAGQQITLGTINNGPSNDYTSYYDVVSGALFVRGDAYLDGTSSTWAGSPSGDDTAAINGTYDKQLAICADFTPATPPTWNRGSGSRATGTRATGTRH